MLSCILARASGGEVGFFCMDSEEEIPQEQYELFGSEASQVKPQRTHVDDVPMPCPDTIPWCSNCLQYSEFNSWMGSSSTSSGGQTSHPVYECKICEKRMEKPINARFMRSCSWFLSMSFSVGSLVLLLNGAAPWAICFLAGMGLLTFWTGIRGNSYTRWKKWAKQQEGR